MIADFYTPSYALIRYSGTTFYLPSFFAKYTTVNLKYATYFFELITRTGCVGRGSFWVSVGMRYSMGVGVAPPRYCRGR